MNYCSRPYLSQLKIGENLLISILSFEIFYSYFIVFKFNILLRKCKKNYLKWMAIYQKLVDKW